MEHDQTLLVFAKGWRGERPSEAAFESAMRSGLIDLTITCKITRDGETQHASWRLTRAGRAQLSAVIEAMPPKARPWPEKRVTKRSGPRRRKGRT